MEDITLIKPTNRLAAFNLRELMHYKELFWILAVRDIKVRYKQTIFGGLWAIAQPLSTMIIFSFFFGNLAKIPSESFPYPIFSYAGLLLWTFFNNTVNVATSSLLNDSRLISKIYFPRIIIPIATTFVSLIDYFVAALVMFVMMWIYKIALTPRIILVLPVFIVTWMLACGISFFFSALNVKYRDIKYVVPFFFQLLIFVTPVIYPVSVSGRFKWLLVLNPLSGLIEAHRALFLGSYPVDWGMVGVSVIFSLVIFISGFLYFKSVEKYFADII